MAYAPDPNDQNAPQQLTGQNNPMNQPPATSSGVGTNTSATGSPQGSTAVPAATKAPPVQDLQAYLTANAPQSVQMGQNIAGNLNETAGRVTGDINAAQQDLSNQVQAQTVAPNPDLIQRAGANPTEFVGAPANVTAFQQQENANYGGPASFESTAYEPALTTEVQNAVQQAPDVTQPSGVAQLARGQETNPTTGMSNLDALLLEENPEAMAPIQGAIPQFGQLEGQLTGAAGSTDKAIQDAVATDAADRAGVQNTFLNGPNAVVPTFQGNVNKELTADQAQVKAYDDALSDLLNKENTANPEIGGLKSAVDAYNKALASGAPRPGGVPTIGNTLSPNGTLPGVPGNYPNTPINLEDLKNPTALNSPTLAQAATPADIAEQNALETLLGTGYTPTFDATGQTPFQSPGAAPNLESLLDPIIANLEPQLATANPNVFQHGPGGISPTTNYPQNIRDAISALQKYLGEPYNFPGLSPDNRPGQTAQKPGQTVF